MVIRVFVVAALLFGASGSSIAQASQSPDPTPTGGQTAQLPAPKADKKPKKAKASQGEGERKPKKKSKKPKGDALAPDEIGDSDAEQVKPRGLHAEWKQHPRIQAGNVFRMDFEAKLQEDARGSYPLAKGLLCQNQALPATCSWELHRNRIGIQGYLFKKITYEVERELTEQELSDKDLLVGYTPKPQWKDVNVNIAYVKNAQVQIGKFKVPFGLDETTGVSHNDFIFRSLGANTLAPGRDVGAQVHGRFFKKGLNYWVGGFRHDGDNARSKRIRGGDETFAARVTGSPFRWTTAPGAANIELGTSFAVSKVSDNSDLGTPNGFRGRTILSQDTFYESVYVKGQRYRWEADADWTKGPVGARAEYTHVIDNRLGQGLGDEDLPNARARAWYFSGTWVLTGEDKTRPVKAADDFLRHGFGAIELAARYERMWFDSVNASGASFRSPRAEGILPEGERALTLGLNWTLNRFVKLQFNGIREHVEDPERNPVPAKPAFWSQIFRVQLVL
jgi:phosphate-selective porin OprO and OprP